MSAEDKGGRGWGSRLDGLIKRVGDEVGGERGEKVRARLTEAKSRVESGLESDEARRIRDEMVTLGDKAMERVDDALRHERTQEVVKRVDATITEIGDRLRGEHPDSPTATTAQKPPTRDAESDKVAGATDPGAAGSQESAASADPQAGAHDASSDAGGVAPAISSNGEDESPTRRA